MRGRGLQVRYPHGYWALRNEASSRSRGTAAPAAALRSPLDATALPLEAQVARSGSGAATEVRVTATLDIRSRKLATVAGRHVGAVVLETVSQSIAGAPLQTSRATLRLQWTEAEYQRRQRYGLKFEQTVQPVAGAATLRLIAEDVGSTVVGSLIIPLANLR